MMESGLVSTSDSSFTTLTGSYLAPETCLSGVLCIYRNIFLLSFTAVVVMFCPSYLCSYFHSLVIQGPPPYNEQQQKNIN